LSLTCRALSFIYIYLYIYIFIYIYVFIYIFIFIYLFMYMYLYLYIYLYIYIYIYIFVYIYLYLYMYRYKYIYIYSILLVSPVKRVHKPQRIKSIMFHPNPIEVPVNHPTSPHLLSMNLRSRTRRVPPHLFKPFPSHNKTF